MLKAFTTRAPVSQRWTCSPPESVCPRARWGPPSKSSGLVASITTLPAKLLGSASWIACSVPPHRVASTTISPKAAASANVPADALEPVFSTQSFSFAGSREPIFTSCPRPAKPAPSALPTSPEPRIPTFIAKLLQLPRLLFRRQNHLTSRQVKQHAEDHEGDQRQAVCPGPFEDGVRGLHHLGHRLVEVLQPPLGDGG